MPPNRTLPTDFRKVSGGPYLLWELGNPSRRILNLVAHTTHSMHNLRWRTRLENLFSTHCQPGAHHAYTAAVTANGNSILELRYTRAQPTAHIA